MEDGLNTMSEAVKGGPLGGVVCELGRTMGRRGTKGCEAFRVIG